MKKLDPATPPLLKVYNSVYDGTDPNIRFPLSQYFSSDNWPFILFVPWNFSRYL